MTAESIDIKVLTDLKPKQDLQDVQDAKDLEQDLQDEQDLSRIYKICKIFKISFRPNRRAGACSSRQDVLLPSEQDQAILRYRGGGDRGDPPPQASVVRDRLIANMSGSGDPALLSGVRRR